MSPRVGARLLLLGLGLLTVRCQNEASTPAPAPVQRFTDQVRAALDQAPVSEPGPQALTITRLTPDEGTVFPWTFLEGDVSWRERFNANVFRVRIFPLQSEAPLLEVFTLERRVHFDAESWGRVREAAGEGGALRVELIAANVAPDGSLHRGPAKRTSHVRFSAAGEHPTGRILFSFRRRPPGVTPGPVPSDMRSATPMALDMRGQASVVIERLPRLPEAASRHDEREQEGERDEEGRSGPVRRRSPGPDDPGEPRGPNREATGQGRPPGEGRQDVPGDRGSERDHPGDPGHPRGDGPTPSELEDLLAQYRSTDFAMDQMSSLDFSPIQRVQGRPAWMLLSDSFILPEGDCMSCHTTSSDGRYLAIGTQNTFVLPEGWTSSLSLTMVLNAKDHTVVRSYLGARSVSFHPIQSDRLLYFRRRNHRGSLNRTSTLRGDIYAAEVESGREWALQGASDLDRCEIFPSWSPDGETVIFSRTLPGRPCSSSFEVYEIATLPWNDGEGGPATTLLGASADMGANIQPRISPDGRWVVFSRASRGYFLRGDSDLWIVPAQGGEARRLSISDDSMESTHAFSPDGRWLIFRSNRDRIDRPCVYLTRFYEDGRTGPAMPLPVAGGPDAHVDWLEWVP